MKAIRTIISTVAPLLYGRGRGWVFPLHYGWGWVFCFLLLVACSSKEDEPSVEELFQGPAIGFRAVVQDGGFSRAGSYEPGDGEFDNADLQAYGFGIYCWYTGSSDFTKPSESIYMLMHNQKVTYDGAIWTYSPEKFWPKEATDKLTFRAYAPYTSYLMADAITGMPLLPVSVKADDYHNPDVPQHDPLWGTGTLDGTDITHEDDDYMPDDLESNKYGDLYNNITFMMSGDKRSEKDDHDGTIHWFFHHGMSKIIFAVSIIQDPGCDKVTIKGIKISPLYDKGLLDISSPTANASEKPWWYDRSGNMEVTLQDEDPSDPSYVSDFRPGPYPEESDPEYDENQPFTIQTKSDAPTDFYPVLKEGLLIIPRDCPEDEAMDVIIYYTIDDDTEVLEAKGKIYFDFDDDTKHHGFTGNTVYTLNMSLTPSTKGIEITVVWAAFTTWNIVEGEGSHTVYNW